MIITPLRYSGGKSRLYKEIKKYFPKNKNTMIDLFFGGGSVGLNWLNESIYNKLIANDIDNDLINFWRCVKNKPNFILAFELYSNDIKESENIFYNLDNIKSYLPSLYYLVRNKCSFNGLSNSKFNKRAFYENFNKSTFDRIKKCNNLLNKCKFYSTDYKYLISSINLEYKNNIFYYLDPPYLISNANKLYKFGHFDHIELAKILNKTKTNWVLSINDCPLIKELYKDFNIYEIETIYTNSNTKSNSCKKLKELVITNFIKGE